MDRQQELFEPGLYLTIKDQTNSHSSLTSAGTKSGATKSARLPFLDIPAGYLVHVLFKFNDGTCLCQDVTTKEIGLITSSFLYKLLLQQVLFTDSFYDPNLHFIDFNAVFLPVFVMIVDGGTVALPSEEPIDLKVIKDSKIIDCLNDLSMLYQPPVKVEKRIDSGIDTSADPQFFEFLKNMDSSDSLESSIESLVDARISVVPSTRAKLENCTQTGFSTKVDQFIHSIGSEDEDDRDYQSELKGFAFTKATKKENRLSTIIAPVSASIITPDNESDHRTANPLTFGMNLSTTLLEKVSEPTLSHYESEPLLSAHPMTSYATLPQPRRRKSHHQVTDLTFNPFKGFDIEDMKTKQRQVYEELVDEDDSEEEWTCGFLALEGACVQMFLNYLFGSR